MRLYVFIGFLFLVSQGVAQTSHAYAFEIEAKMGQRPLSPILFSQIDENAFFTAACDYKGIGFADTLFVSILDSCGVTKASNSLILEKFVSVRESFHVKKFGSNYILWRSGFRTMFILNDQLQITSQPPGVFSNLRHAPNAKNYFVSYSQVPGYGLRQHRLGGPIELTNPTKGTVEIFRPILSKSPDDFMVRAATCDDSGNMFVAGSIVHNQNDQARMFITKHEPSGAVIFYREYSLQNSANEVWPSEIVLAESGEIHLFSHRHGADFCLVSLDEFGEILNQEYHALRVQDVAYSTKTGTDVYGGVASLFDHTYRVIWKFSPTTGVRFFKIPTGVSSAGYETFQGIQNKFPFSPVGGPVSVQGISINNKLGECAPFLDTVPEVKSLTLMAQELSSEAPYYLEKAVYFPSKYDLRQTSLMQEVNWMLNDEDECSNLTSHSLPTVDSLLCPESDIALTARFRSKYDSVIWESGDTTRTVNVSQPGLYANRTYHGFCVVHDTQQIDFFDSVEVDLPVDTANCPLDTLSFSLPIGNFQYEWIHPDGQRTKTPHLTPIREGWYKLRLSGANCEVLDSTNISFHKMPAAVTGPDGKICRGDTFQLFGDGGESFTWTPAEFLDNGKFKNPKAFPPNTQLYRLVVASKEGCHDTDFVNLEVHAYAKVQFAPGLHSIPLSAENVQFTNQSTQTNHSTWFVNGKQASNERHFQFELSDTGLYRIKLLGKNHAGCNDSFEQQIRVLPVSFMFIPNAFTPNGDGINETFAPSTFYIEEYQMTIFSRWGQRIWKSRSGEAFPAWDATMDQSKETVPLGTYQYLVKAATSDGKVLEYSGKVHVVK